MLSQIYNCYDHLTDAERKIADTVLNRAQDTVKMTVKELAECSGTVPSAVVRFCKSIGATGFSEFKVGLSAELGGKMSASGILPVGKGDTAQQVFGKVFASGINTLEDTLSMIDYSQVEAIVQLVRKATRVVFFWRGYFFRYRDGCTVSICSAGHTHLRLYRYFVYERDCGKSEL